MHQVETRNRAADPSLWIDLGCGTAKQAGFVGFDRFAMPGVDIVCDLDHGIPIDSGIADYVLASHSLEHLRDLPAIIKEIHRVCKDRALVTIIAPYNATQLNRANPYHFQVWNEHTARFFTADSASRLDPEEYDFPSINEWGLSGSDHSSPDVDLRCLRMEFHYFPPYRGLDEQAKRTLRRSLSDVCDQMALDLLVVKSPISREELSRRAETIQYPVSPAFEARRRAEADTGAQNLFSELARTPARVTALATKANEEIGLLGGEMRRFIQRIDHVERALVAETQDTRRALSELVDAGRTLSERMTAVNSAMTRRMQATADELRGAVAAELQSAANLRSAHAKAGEQIQLHLVAERRAREDRALRPIRFLRRYLRRGTDRRVIAAGPLQGLWQGPETPQSNDFKLQLGTFLEANVARVYPLLTAGSPLRGLDIGVSTMFPPIEPVTIADFELTDSNGATLRGGSLNVDQSCNVCPITIDFQPLICDPGRPLTLRLIPRSTVERTGVQVLEWHRITRILRRVRELRLAHRGRY